jgi:hypothetical protein
MAQSRKYNTAAAEEENKSVRDSDSDDRTAEQLVDESKNFIL